MKLRVDRHPNPLRERGIAISRFTNVSVNPSLTRRVVMIRLVFALLIFPSLEQRNFKTRQRGIFPKHCVKSKSTIPRSRIGLGWARLEKVSAGISDVDLSDFLWILDRKEKSQGFDVSKCPIGLVCLFLSGGVEGTRVVGNPDAFRLTA